MGTATMGSPMTRQEALKWCAGNAIPWPTRETAPAPLPSPPSGWKWELSEGEWQLANIYVAFDTISEGNVIDRRNIPGPASRSAVLEWCADNITVWPAVDAPTVKVPPAGWEWMFIGDVSRLERVDKRGEAIIEAHWRDAKNLKDQNSMGQVKALTYDEAIEYLRKKLPVWPSSYAPLAPGVPTPPGWNWNTKHAGDRYIHTVWRGNDTITSADVIVIAAPEPVAVERTVTICGVKVKVGDRVKVKINSREFNGTLAGVYGDRVWFEGDQTWWVGDVTDVTGLAHLTDRDVAVEQLINLIPQGLDPADIAKALIDAGVKLP